MKKKTLTLIHPQKSGIKPTTSDLDLNRLRSAQRLMDDVASQIPPLSPAQIHALVQSKRLPQFQLRRQADCYLLIFCIFVLALLAILLWHSAPVRLSTLNVAILILAVAHAWVAIRAARSLWLMWQTSRLRHRPFLMARYAQRLNRLSLRRRLWTNYILHLSSDSDTQPQITSRRIPAYALPMMSIIFLASVSSWIVIVNHKSDKVILSSSNLTAPSVVDSKLVPPFDAVADTILSPEPAFVHPQEKNSTYHSQPSQTVMTLPATEPPTQETNDPTISNAQILDKKSTIEMLHMLAANGNVQVTCNSESCSAETYYTLLYEDILGI